MITTTSFFTFEGNLLSVKVSSNSGMKRVMLISGESALGEIEKGDVTTGAGAGANKGGGLVITLPQERYVMLLSNEQLVRVFTFYITSYLLLCCS